MPWSRDYLKLNFVSSASQLDSNIQQGVHLIIDLRKPITVVHVTYSMNSLLTEWDPSEYLIVTTAQTKHAPIVPRTLKIKRIYLALVVKCKKQEIKKKVVMVS